MDEMSLSKQIGLEIKKLREVRKIKQFELAELIEIEPTNLSKIENGVYLPREDKLQKIANVLNAEIKVKFETPENLQTKEHNIKAINKILKNMKDNEVEYFYKILRMYCELF